MSAIIDTEFSHVTASGPRYRVFHGGELLLASSRNPICDAARALVAKGVTGRVQQRRVGSSQIDMEGLIAVLATKTTTEGQSQTIRLAGWSPHWASEDAV